MEEMERKQAPQQQTAYEPMVVVVVEVVAVDGEVQEAGFIKLGASALVSEAIVATISLSDQHLAQPTQQIHP
jgi:hypothetical protein